MITPRPPPVCLIPGSPLFPHRPQIPTFVAGMVKVLAKLSPAERSTIGSEVVLVPDKNGTSLFPASSLVYDDASWLTSRLRQINLMLVHPEVGNDAARAVGVRSLREMFIDSQGGKQVRIFFFI